VSTIDVWKGKFGDTYHKRNRFSPDDVRPVFDRILKGITLTSVLEVGCGQGHNLMAIDAPIRTGIEPNKAARNQANKEHGVGMIAFDGDAADLAFFDASFDLVLTCGLLIHISPGQIRKVVGEIARVSSKYVLLIEYAAVEEEAVEYRGEKDILWRRPFGKLFMAWEGMKLVAWDDEPIDMYPGCCWWLLEK
jgi:ubiquinone/menaquinone biosynthesis C-methylase UbiE